tara:strand:- start:245 stop:532 length:288 start_codon:yes stop_codon:yes gene_type:complete
MEFGSENEKKTLYGWYSEKQKEVINRKLCYLNSEKKEVWVTEVSHNKNSPTGFDDRVFLGEVLTRVFKTKEEKEDYANAVKKFGESVRDLCKKTK